jgi:hypothetical protein
MRLQADRDRDIAEAIAKTNDEAVQIDIAMEKRGCFKPNTDSKFYSIIQEYMENDSRAEDFTPRLLAPINRALVNNEKHLDLLNLWYSIIHSAKRLPFRDTTSLEKLVALMKAIKASSPPPNIIRLHLFHSLHNFGLAARETMNDCPGGGCGYLVPEVHAYTNMLYFYALLTREKIVDFWIYCIWEMREALETPHEDDTSEFRQSDRRVTAADRHNATVPPAAMWIFALGREVYEREHDHAPKRPSQGNPGTGGPLWTGKSGFSKARWALWKKRFDQIAKMGGITDEVRGIALEAVSAMDEIERAV